MMTALVGLVLIGALGGVSDLSMQRMQSSRLQRAADAAALAAAKKLEQNLDLPAGDDILTMAAANLPADLKSANFTTVIDKTARTVRVEARATIRPHFLPLLRINELSIEVAAVSSIARRHHSNFYIMLDVSESMNLAASEDDRRKLEALTEKWMSLTRAGKMLAEDGRPRTCAFACHRVEPGWSDLSVFQMNEKEGQANPENKARLRIDVVRDATRTMISRILGENENAASTWRTKIATAFFSESFVWGLDPSDDASAVAATLTSNRLPYSAHTHYEAAFDAFGRKIGVNGDGTTQEDAEKVAIVITDGVSNTSDWALSPIAPEFCRDIKAKGIKLAILEIKYLRIVDKYGYFNWRVEPFYGDISSGLKDCASDGLYYQATDADQAASKLVDMTRSLLPPASHLAR